MRGVIYASCPEKCRRRATPQNQRLWLIVAGSGGLIVVGLVTWESSTQESEPIRDVWIGPASGFCKDPVFLPPVLALALLIILDQPAIKNMINRLQYSFKGERISQGGLRTDATFAMPLILAGLAWASVPHYTASAYAGRPLAHAQ